MEGLPPPQRRRWGPIVRGLLDPTEHARLGSCRCCWVQCFWMQGTFPVAMGHFCFLQGRASGSRRAGLADLQPGLRQERGLPTRPPSGLLASCLLHTHPSGACSVSDLGRVPLHAPGLLSPPPSAGGLRGGRETPSGSSVAQQIRGRKPQEPLPGSPWPQDPGREGGATWPLGGGPATGVQACSALCLLFPPCAQVSSPGKPHKSASFVLTSQPQGHRPSSHPVTPSMRQTPASLSMSSPCPLSSKPSSLSEILLLLLCALVYSLSLD